MSFRKQGMGSGKIGVIVSEFAVLVSAWNTRRRQQGLSPRSELAVTTGHAAVVDAIAAIVPLGDCFPACTFAQWANCRWGLNHLGTSFSNILFRLVTLEGNSRKLQTLTGCVHPVKD